ncbi:transglutaminase-like domain-containing protein [Rhodohalobacter sp. 614A]|uniref:transglutaminase-like domain-containing protein n=1 Tax=Rhodohalobacter sp. 614A TaxID=2908649 RepID=UPI001F398A83|nr:transglutaminase-like domain-containing protein [Rhodohalobacter sp. 614A]
MNESNKREIESLIYLLDDPDPEVQTGVKKRFKELGEHAVPLLDQFRSESVKDSQKQTINNIIYNITAGTVIEEFAEIVEMGVHDRKQLEGALFTLCKFGNPTLRIEEYRKKLDNLSAQIGSDIAYTPSISEKMQIMLQFVFRDLRFRGDSKDYHNPDNAYLDRVIDRRKGLPIMLSCVVMLLAHRLDLPFYGVNMPIHFMLMYETHNQEILIDPFDGGTLVSYNQCCYFLKKNGINPKPEHLQKADEADILIRCIRNLIHSYAKVQDEKRVADLRRLLQIAELKR